VVKAGRSSQRRATLEFGSCEALAETDVSNNGLGPLSTSQSHVRSHTKFPVVVTLAYLPCVLGVASLNCALGQIRSREVGKAPVDDLRSNGDPNHILCSTWCTAVSMSDTGRNTKIWGHILRIVDVARHISPTLC